MERSEERPRLICRCLGVASPRVYTVVRSQGLDSVTAVTKAVRAGGGCGLCHPELEEVLAEVRGEPVDPGLAIENHLICREETRARVAGVIESVVRPRLTPLGNDVAAFEVEGLRVRVRLAAPDDEAGFAAVCDALRRGVCPDLEVERLSLEPLR